MAKYMFDAKFDIGDKVYHITPESSAGVIIDMSYKLATNELRYLIVTGWANEVWAIESEISRDKIII